VNTPHLLSLLTTVSAAALLTGCATNPDAQTMNRRQPGPAVGQAIGVGVGTVASNAVAVPVGIVEGAAAATQSTFTNERRVIRTWREEKTSDGRTIRVPVEIEVDANGKPIAPAK
jgi:hypothetical protein